MAMLALTSVLCGADRIVLAPAGAAKPVGPYSPALAVGDFVYVSGQGVRDGESRMPNGLEAQTEQCLANVRANLEAGGLDFGHVVAAQLYVADLATISAVERLWNKAFPAPGPATIRLGVARMPTGTTVEITVVAVKSLQSRRRERGGIRGGRRTYLDAVYGATRKEVEAKLAAAKSRLLTCYLYSTESTEASVIPVAALPAGARWAAFAVASKEPKRDTIYCDVVQGSAGDVESQTEEAFARLESCLAGNGAALKDLVATNVYLSDIDDFTRMNAVYARKFSSAFPTRTTIQPAAKPGGPLVRISGVAVK
jgi:2-iminobutanoate/2-iminopropanoate deaminase